MTSEQLITSIRAAQSQGLATLDGTLARAIKGVKRIRLANLDGARNGNPHDVWVESQGGKRVLGRICLGSRRMPANTEGWEQVVEDLR